jgi:hypothetical protein
MPTLLNNKKTVKKPKFDKTRALSWSAISSFEYDPEQWYRKYVLLQPDPENEEMRFGKRFADSCEKRKPLAPVTLLSKMEQKFEVVFCGIKLIGYADTFDDVTFKALGEYKTGVKEWDQRRVDEHGQITLYCLFNYVTKKIKPEDMDLFLQWIPTRKISQENGDFSRSEYTIDFVRPIKVHTFRTRRNMKDVVEFGAKIKRVYKEMEMYAKNHA